MAQQCATLEGRGSPQRVLKTTCCPRTLAQKMPSLLVEPPPPQPKRPPLICITIIKEILDWNEHVINNHTPFTRGDSTQRQSQISIFEKSDLGQRLVLVM